MLKAATSGVLLEKTPAGLGVFCEPLQVQRVPGPKIGTLEETTRCGLRRGWFLFLLIWRTRRGVPAHVPSFWGIPPETNNSVFLFGFPFTQAQPRHFLCFASHRIETIWFNNQLLVLGVSPNQPTTPNPQLAQKRPPPPIPHPLPRVSRCAAAPRRKRCCPSRSR